MILKLLQCVWRLRWDPLLMPTLITVQLAEIPLMSKAAL